MIEFLSNLFASDFMPHGHCYFWRPEILWLNVGSDLGIGLAYFTIPLALLVFVRRREDLAFRRVFLLFSAFILACGTTHLFDIVTVWTPMYRLEGVLKLVTALVSASTAIVLWRLLPAALRLPSPAQLAAANADLSAEVERREAAEARLRESNEELELRVRERTEALARSNRDLQQFAYVASHDLQEPLRMVSSYVGLLDKRFGEALDERGQRYVGHALEGAQRMRRMIEDLLELSRAGESLGPADEVEAEACLEAALDAL
ncbi:MAG TPA: histidine kinase dimerization/phospho-acceptor domain-containing protein, partial [Polyangiaceae bacterium LLY-WYZ-15_(1-7)]|nr:histidine kinase dimerization/phospho-acceptor domain-containing protein [Polyangiaceae bacterium LLY-WYZ-15_(1-7)]